MNEVTLSFECTGVDWAQAAQVFECAPLGTREPSKLKRSFENSSLVCFAWSRGTLVGFARALTDFEYQGSIYDMCVSPKYQGKGLGRTIMEALLKRLPVETIILFAVPGKETFYEKLGFHRMTTAMGRFVHLQKMRDSGYVF